MFIMRWHRGVGECIGDGVGGRLLAIVIVHIWLHTSILIKPGRAAKRYWSLLANEAWFILGGVW